MEKRLLIITDSLGAPRHEPETVSYEDTWVYGVKKAFERSGYDVFCITHNGLHSSELLSLTQTKLTLYGASVAIIQCGVVDSAPRVLTDREIRFFQMIRLQKIVRYIAHRFHAPLSLWRNITLHKPEDFSRNMRGSYDALKNIRDCVVVQVPIAPACSGYVKKSPLISKNILKFNKALKASSDIYVGEFSGIMPDTIEKIFMDDFHHLNIAGHKLLQDMVLSSVSALIHEG